MAISKITSIVAYTDMKGKYSLDINSDYTSRFDQMVIDNEYKVLTRMLGASLYNTYRDNELLTAWTDLLNGVENYTDYASIVRDWQGLKYLMVPHHYSEWIKINRYHSALTGLVLNDQENSTLLSASEVKRISDNAFNEFLRRYNEAYIYLYTNLDTYTDFNLYFWNYSERGFILSKTVK